MVLTGSTADLGGVLGKHEFEGNREYIWCYTSADVVRGQVGVITYDGDEETNPTFSTPATSSVYQYVGVAVKAQDVSVEGYFIKVQIKGDAEALVEGTTDVAKDDFLEVLNTEDSFKKDASSRSTNSVCIAQEAQASDSEVLTNVYLLGERVIVAAS